MPYRLIGKTIYTKATGKWKKKQTCHSVPATKRALKLLRGIEHGTITPRQAQSYKNRHKKKKKR